MDTITGLVQTAMFIVLSIAAVLISIFGLLVYIRKTGEEEGE